MKTANVRSKLKSEKSNANSAYVDCGFKELEQANPQGLPYVFLQLEDGLSSMHLALMESNVGTNRLTETGAFKTFARDIKDHCDEWPMAMSADIPGSYPLFWDRPPTGA